MTCLFDLLWLLIRVIQLGFIRWNKNADIVIEMLCGILLKLAL